MASLIMILFAVLLVSLCSLAGIFLITLKRNLLNKLVPWLVAIASGALLGGAFLDLLPEAFDRASTGTVLGITLFGILTFFVIEKLLFWRHCHEDRCDVHAFTYMSLIGDGIHNVIDGIIIAASFIAGIPFGISTTVAIIAHEIPQEMGDFAVLIYGGFSKKKALIFNFFTALTSIIGAIAGYYLIGFASWLVSYLLAFAAGGFIYVASTDLIPELHKTKRIGHSIVQFFFLLLGIGMISGIHLLAG